MKYYVESWTSGKSYIQEKRSRANWTGHMWPRNCLLKHGTEGRLGVMGKWERRRKQALGDLTEMTGYWKLKEESLHSTVEKLLWKRLWTCLKSDYEMDE
jgi:hypothetical protein